MGAWEADAPTLRCFLAHVGTRAHLRGGSQGKDGMYQVWDLEVSGGGSKGEGACASACASVESVGAGAQAAFDLHSFCKCVLVGGDVSGAVTGAGASELVALPYASCDVSLILPVLLVCLAASVGARRRVSRRYCRRGLALLLCLTSFCCACASYACEC